MQRRTIFIGLAYTVFFLAIVSSLALFLGLTFYHAQTMLILTQLATYGLIVGTALIALFIVKKYMEYRHRHRMTREEYHTARAARIKEEEAANVLRMEAYVKEQEAELTKAKMYIQQQELAMSQQRFAMDIEAARVRLEIEQRQASLLKVSASESVYAIQGSELRQLVQGQLPMRAMNNQKVISEQVAQQSLPHAPTFGQMQGLISGQQHMVLAYTNMAPIYGTLEDHLLSMLFTGRPKTGKSSALLYYAAMFLKVGVLPVVLDPQGSLPELKGVVPYRDTMQGIHEIIPLLYREFEEREELWRSGRILKPYSLVVMIDELPMIAAWEERYLSKDEIGVIEMTQKVILELRKLLVYIIAAGQGFPYTVMPVLSRENTSSRLIFPTSERYAKMAGLGDKYIKTMLPQLNAVERGTGILDISCEKEPYLIDIPYTTIHDVVAQVNGNASYHELIPMFAEQRIIPNVPVYTMQQKKPTRAEVEEAILAQVEQGVTGIREIARQTGINYNTVRPVYKDMETEGLITQEKQEA